MYTIFKVKIVTRKLFECYYEYNIPINYDIGTNNYEIYINKVEAKRKPFQ